jgi:hypothetical protein
MQRVAEFAKLALQMMECLTLISEALAEAFMLKKTTQVMEPCEKPQESEDRLSS